MAEDIEEIPGGLSYKYWLPLDVQGAPPPVEYRAATMKATNDPATFGQIESRFGLEDVRIVPYEEAECAKKDPDHWALFVKEPPLAVVTARKVKTV